MQPGVVTSGAESSVHTIRIYSPCLRAVDTGVYRALILSLRIGPRYQKYHKIEPRSYVYEEQLDTERAQDTSKHVAFALHLTQSLPYVV